jgi:hypothetical protein
MSIKKQQQQESKLIDEALKIGPQADRRRFFVSAAAFGAVAAASGRRRLWQIVAMGYRKSQ